MSTSSNSQNPPSDPACAICFDPTFKLPVSLECGHHFCFLCIKSVLDTDPNPKCPLCRQVVQLTSDDLKIDPSLQGSNSVSSAMSHTYYWQYRGRNYGWWNYEDEMSSEIEKAYRTYLWKEREKELDQEYDLPDPQDSQPPDTRDYSKFDLQIVNTEYQLDFANNLQVNQSDPGKKRTIRRVSMYDQDTKGTAGLRNYYS